MHIPSLQTLRAFDAAGRHQSYSKAGAELGLTHSAVSYRIRDLEALTGKRLFVRQGNRMLPTAEGTRLLAQVRNALGLLESIFMVSSNRTKRRVTISVFPAMSSWLVPRIAAFRERFPDIDISLDLSSKVVELGKGIDAAVRYGTGSWPLTESQLLAEECLFPVCSPDYLAAHPLREPGDLLRCNLLRHPWHSWAAWFQAASVSSGEPSDGPEYSDSSLLHDAALAGEGVALARGRGVADALRHGKLVRPFPIAIPDSRAYYFVRPEGVRDPRLDVIQQWLSRKLHKDAEALEPYGSP